MPSQNRTYSFLAMWDMNGLEVIYDLEPARAEIETWEKENLFAMIKEEQHRSKPRPIPLHSMILRARMNSQRSYEIYEFKSTFDIDRLKELFKNESQIIVNWIRETGYKVYSDYSSKQHNQVTR
jgi:hypothetical protein